MRKASLFIKRLFDVFASFLGLIILSPVFLLFSLWIKMDSKGSVFFCQERLGLHGKTFKLIKFRTMTNEKDANGKLLPDKDRLNKYGRIIRATSLDELPSLINIIKGDISIVGPRPLAIDYLPYYTNHERHRHDVRPGLTGLAQVNGRTAVSWQKKFSYDLEYVKRCSFRLDLEIILKTVIKTIKKSDIYVGSAVPWGRFDDMRKKELAEKSAEVKGETRI